MKLKELAKIKKLYFGYEEIARVFGITESSAKVTASRYVRLGLLLRLKRNMYVRKEVWDGAGLEVKFLFANLGQVPSYISLTTALEYYDVTTQVQRDYYESVAVKRTKQVNLRGSVFRYTKIADDLYFGFKKEKEFFIATPEKAFLDAFYLMSYGRYSLDISSLDEGRLDKNEVKRLSSQFPLKTRKALRKYGYLQAA
jgi:predicted transcriptional regulator of viral defense system